ncbi:hypothetical protein Tco_0788213 [Tanacetum coccineum]
MVFCGDYTSGGLLLYPSILWELYSGKSSFFICFVRLRGHNLGVVTRTKSYADSDLCGMDERMVSALAVYRRLVVVDGMDGQNADIKDGDREKVYDNTSEVLTSLMDPFSRGAFHGTGVQCVCFFAALLPYMNRRCHNALVVAATLNSLEGGERRRLTQEKSNLLSYYWISGGPYLSLEY